MALLQEVLGLIPRAAVQPHVVDGQQLVARLQRPCPGGFYLHLSIVGSENVMTYDLQYFNYTDALVSNWGVLSSGSSSR